MKTMVIGAAGFVGSYLIEAIRKNLHSEVVATKLPHETILTDHADIVDLNILDEQQVKEVLEAEQPDYIFHLAAQSSVALSWKNPKLTVDINIKGAINLLDRIRQLAHQPKVVVIGSGEEYGYIKEGMVPIREDNPLFPGNIYAITKACQNAMATIYSDAYGLDIVLVRAFNHVGPRQLPQFVVADFCRQVVEIEKGMKEPVIRVGNLTAKRDFTDVRDVVNAYTLLMMYGRRGETYNVGSGHAVAIQDILLEILKQTDRKIEIVVDPERLRPVDVPIIEADTTKIFNDTGWKPTITIQETIADTLAYWRETL